MSIFRSFLRRQNPDVSTDATAARMLKEVVQSCPRCGLELVGHEYRLAAATPLSADEIERFRDLLSAVRSHDWRKVLTFQRWTGSQPNAEVYCVKCPDQKLSLAMISAPFDLNEPYTLMHKELVEEDAIFSAVLPDTDTWHRF